MKKMLKIEKYENNETDETDMLKRVLVLAINEREILLLNLLSR
jgi:hypothetical protein